MKKKNKDRTFESLDLRPRTDKYYRDFAIKTLNAEPSLFKDFALKRLPTEKIRSNKNVDTVKCAPVASKFQP